MRTFPPALLSRIRTLSAGEELCLSLCAPFYRTQTQFSVQSISKPGSFSSFLQKKWRCNAYIWNAIRQIIAVETNLSPLSNITKVIQRFSSGPYVHLFPRFFGEIAFELTCFFARSEGLSFESVSTKQLCTTGFQTYSCAFLSESYMSSTGSTTRDEGIHSSRHCWRERIISWPRWWLSIFTNSTTSCTSLTC